MFSNAPRAPNPMSTSFLPPRPVTYRGFAAPATGDRERNGSRSLLDRFDAASWQLLAMLGLGPQRLGVARLRFVSLEQRVTNVPAAQEAGTLHIESELLEVAATTLRYRHTLFDSETGRALATLERHVALEEADGGRPVALPPVVRRRARTLFPMAAQCAGARAGAVAA